MHTDQSLELLFSDNTWQLTGVAVSKKGRLFTCYPRWEGPHRFDVVEIGPDNAVTPYPDAAMNSWKEGEDGKDKWVCVQAVFVDDEDFLWVVDPACPKMEKVYEESYKLVKFNLTTNSVEKVYRFSGVLSDKSYINDIRVDTIRKFAYLTNSNEGGIVVINLETGEIKELLKAHYSVKHDPSYTLEVDGKEFKKKGKAVHIQSDGIALTPDGEWLYYKPLTDNKLYRVPAAVLRGATGEDEAEDAVEDLGKVSVTDGMIFDPSGNLYLGDFQNYRMIRITPDGRRENLIVDLKLIWPDSYAVSDDEYLYISCSQINKQPAYNGGEDKRTSPYTIYRIKL